MKGRPAWLAELSSLGKRALIVFGVWTLFSLLNTNLVYFLWTQAGDPIPVPLVPFLRYTLPVGWIWALLALPLITLARRFPVTAQTWRKNIPLHLGLALLAHLIHSAALYFLHPYIRSGPRPVMPDYFIGNITPHLFLYAALVAMVHAVDAQGQTLRLRNQLLESQLHVLRMQLQPHFLFNTLHTISELVHEDARRAEQALVRLGDLLRWSLRSSKRKDVALREEITALEHYIEIMRLRYGDQLRIRVEADENAMDLAVPSLLLQPLVENAIRHGVAGSPSGRVQVEAMRRDGMLHVTVEDNGRGLDPGHAEGTGLGTTRARLMGLFGKQQHVTIGPGSAGGTLVTLSFPARPASTEEVA